MKHVLTALAAVFAAAVGPSAWASLPECTDAMTADLPSSGVMWKTGDGDDANIAAAIRGPAVRARFAEAPVQYPSGSRKRYGFKLTYVVGAEGRVTCASATSAWGQEAFEMTPQRRAYLDRMAAWQFDPYLVNGKAVAVVIETAVDEEELPAAHVDAPDGDPSRATITFEDRPWMASFGPFHVELHGDGTAIYMSLLPDDPLGSQTYHVDAKVVQAIIEKAKAADFWSLRDAYKLPVSPNSDDWAYERINITLDGVTKSLTDYDGHAAGMPESVSALHDTAFSAARIGFWQTPGLTTLDQLKANGFDFRGERAARLLLRMMQKPSVPDDAVRALMALGAPRTARGYNGLSKRNQTLTEAALSAGRVEIAASLIKDGTLEVDGKTSPYLVNSAFAEAVRSGRLKAVDLMIPYHPAMTVSDPDDEDTQMPVILLLADTWSPEEDRVAVAKRLIGMGASVNARTVDGRTLLHRVGLDQIFVRFLLAQGADVNAVDSDGRTPLSDTFDEDMALLFLSYGANPRQGKSAQELRFNIKYNHWNRVRTWLASHGYGDVLVPQAGDH